ncbi:MAG: glycosyl transferase [Pseudomonadota bacterium]
MADDGATFNGQIGGWQVQTPSARPMTESLAASRIAYLGHDASDAAVRRRMRALLDDGLSVTGFMPHRRAPKDLFWDHVDLGETRDGAFAQRIKFIFAGAKRIADEPGFAEADLIIARNLDMLGMAFEAKRRARLATPVIYECLDVHRMLTRRDAFGASMRTLERALLKRCARVWVSSPGFLENHFDVYHSGLFAADLMENRLPAASEFGPRPGLALPRKSGPFRLGWIGNLRCQRSFQLLLDQADRFGEQIEIHLHGVPARREIEVFEPEIDARANVTFHGRYQAPDDLAEIYAPLDAVWAGDFMEAGANSEWLLPNRLYEGGYFGVPPIAPSGTQTAAWINAQKTGLLIDEPLDTTLPSLLADLIKAPAPLETARERLLTQSTDTFVEPRGEMARLVRSALQLGVAR